MLIFRAVFILLVLAILSIGVYMIALQSPNHKRCYKNKTERFEYVDNNNIEAGIKIPEIQADGFSINKSFIVGTDKNYAIKTSENITDPVDIPKISANEITLNGKNILEIIYPVGCVYISMTDTNPAATLGFGTWEQIKDNRFLLCSDSPGKTGGNSKISTDQLPKHNHVASSSSSGSHQHKVDIIHGGGNYGLQANSYAYGDRFVVGKIASESYDKYSSTDNIGSHTHDITINETGKGEAYWQPYITCYAWKRTK